MVCTLQPPGPLWAPRPTSGLQGPSGADPSSVTMVTLVPCPQTPWGTARSPFPRGLQSHCGYFCLRVLQRWLGLRTVRSSGVTLSKDMGVLGTRCRRVLLTVYPLDQVQRRDAASSVQSAHRAPGQPGGRSAALPAATPSSPDAAQGQTAGAWGLPQTHWYQ